MCRHDLLCTYDRLVDHRTVKAHCDGPCGGIGWITPAAMVGLYGVLARRQSFDDEVERAAGIRVEVHTVARQAAVVLSLLHEGLIPSSAHVVLRADDKSHTVVHRERRLVGILLKAPRREAWLQNLVHVGAAPLVDVHLVLRCRPYGDGQEATNE